MIRTLMVLFGMSGLLFGDDEPKQKVQAVRTERMDFPSGGLLRFKNSIGELTVEGWDRSDVEITTIKSTKALYAPRERERGSHELDKVRISVERPADGVIISTDFPRHRGFPPSSPFGSATRLKYEIKVPRNARLLVDHDVGEVHLDNITGDLHVTALQGLITLRLPQNGQYAIDAKSDFGSVTSDFPGLETRRFWLVGHQFAQNASSASQNLFLRIGYGDILILRAKKPPTPAPLSQ